MRSKVVTEEYYKNLGKELAEMGIVIPINDVGLLVNMVIKNMVKTLDDKTKIIKVNNATSIRRSRINELKFKYGERIFESRRRFTITDKSNTSILERIFLPLLELEAEDL